MFDSHIELLWPQSNQHFSIIVEYQVHLDLPEVFEPLEIVIVKLELIHIFQFFLHFTFLLVLLTLQATMPLAGFLKLFVCFF